MRPKVRFARWIPSLIACLTLAAATARGDYTVQSFVSDSGGTPVTDTNLVNGWGIGLNPAGGAFWVSDNGSDSTSLYSGDVNGSPLTKTNVAFQNVTIPGGAPTGQVFNSTSSFVVSNGTTSGPAAFIFASESGNITGWNPNVAPNTTAKLGTSVTGAIFKGLAIGSSNSANFLYATDFGHGTIDVFNGSFGAASLPGTFTDPNLPAGYVPFNVQNLNNRLYVTYAFKSAPTDTDETPGAGLGMVDTFDTSGNFLGRLVSPGGALNAPWGLAIAPSNFGQFSNDLLVGNFGDGKIHAYDPTTGTFQGTLQSNGSDLSIDGLWGMTFGNGVTAGDTNKLYFAAGPEDESHGLFGAISVPEPATLAGVAAVLPFLFRRRRRK